jgi:hypothetical protein
VVNKTPEGTRSPNIGDAVIMAANPVSGLKPVITIAKNQFEVSPFKVPAHFTRGFSMLVQGQSVRCLWAAYDNDAGCPLFHHRICPRLCRAGGPCPGHRGAGQVDSRHLRLRCDQPRDFEELMRLYHGHGLPLLAPADRAVEAGIGELQQRIATGRAKVFSTCQGFFADYRSFRRGEDGRIVGGGLMDCARQLARPEAVKRMAVEKVETRGGAARNLYA